MQRRTECRPVERCALRGHRSSFLRKTCSATIYPVGVYVKTNRAKQSRPSSCPYSPECVEKGFSEVRTQPAHVPSASECVGWLPCVPSTGLGRLPHPPGDDEKPDAPRKHQG